MDPETLINQADFTEWEVDSGTSGFCAMFALALYRAVLPMQPTLVLIGATRDGEVLRTDGGIHWRHAAVKVGSKFYDIEGEQQTEWMFSNYLWGMAHVTPAVIELSPQEFLAEIRTTKNARDWRFYTVCKKKFDAVLATA